MGHFGEFASGVAMKFYPYWSRSAPRFSHPAYGYSDVSLSEALERANARAQTLATMIESGNLPDRRYGYGDERPLREEILEQFTHDGATVAVITRNAYGAMVLNTAQTFFADIDLPQPKASVFGRLFGGQKKDPSQAIVEKIQSVAASDRSLGFRLYRTAGGFRCLGRSTTMAPESPDCLALLKALGSDDLYVRLCQSQRCFRARLTPKPWRIGCDKPPDRFPFRSAESAQAYRQWVADYDRRRAAYTVCAVVGDVGNPQTDAAVEPVMQLHDHYACGPGEPLA
jgi:hypothetical protein